MPNITPLKRDPIYLQISDDLRSKIIKGVWPTGTKIPGEYKLAEYYATSRVTIRKSMDLLVNEGFIKREPGRGTFVIEQVFIGGPRGFNSLTNEMQLMGLKPSSVILKHILVEADQLVAKRLGIRIGDKVVLLNVLEKVTI